MALRMLFQILGSYWLLLLNPTKEGPLVKCWVICCGKYVCKCHNLWL